MSVQQTTPRRRGPPIGLIVLALAAAALVYWVAKPPKAAERPRPAPVAVAVARVKIQDVEISLQALGQAQAWQGVLIRPQVGGRLLRVLVREGQDVRAGALIAQVDPAPYQAMLQEAEGALKRDRAVLEGARVQLARFKQLASQDSIAQQTVDTQDALVKQNEGAVLIDQGAVSAARVNLNFTRITAPVAGRVGVRTVDAGNLVAANDAASIVSINQLEPIAVTFSVPEGEYQRLSDLSARFQRPLTVTAFSQETSAALGRGELRIADNHVDPSTGTIQMKARFSNEDRRLIPGQFVNVRLVLQTLADALTVPSGAVNHGPNGTFAYVVGQNSKVAVRPVGVISTQDGAAVIASGLRAGETVVVDGQLSLKPGAKVRARGPDEPGRRRA